MKYELEKVLVGALEDGSRISIKMLAVGGKLSPHSMSLGVGHRAISFLLIQVPHIVPEPKAKPQ